MGPYRNYETLLRRLTIALLTFATLLALFYLALGLGIFE